MCLIISEESAFCTFLCSLLCKSLCILEKMSPDGKCIWIHSYIFVHTCEMIPSCDRLTLKPSDLQQSQQSDKEEDGCHSSHPSSQLSSLAGCRGRGGAGLLKLKNVFTQIMAIARCPIPIPYQIPPTRSTTVVATSI